jgi:choice-of-anchor C domain-containing protein
MIRSFISAAAVTLALGSGVSAATITNGSFEAPGTFSGNFTTLGAGDLSLTGWSIDSGSIDLINGYWPASDGAYSVDMSGNSPATISTVITGLVAGFRYLISFDMAANTDGLPFTKLLDVAIGTFSGQYAATDAPPEWTTYSFDFVASAASQTLSFSSVDDGPGFYGAALDNVQIATVPVPAAGLMLLAGLGGLAALRRRKAFA